MKKNKISIIGAGHVGAQIAFLATIKEFGDIVLVDILEDMVKGKALDLFQATPSLQKDISVLGTTDYKETKDSDIVVITAGLPRKDGMTREDILEKNAGILRSIVPKITEYSPNAILIVVTNPLDVMTYLVKKISKLPSQRVIGMAGALDSARFQTYIAQEAKVNVSDVSAMVIGEHGGTLIPLSHLAKINNTLLTGVLSEKQIQSAEQRAKKGGLEIMHYLKDGSAFFAPAAAVINMIESILKDQKKILPCSVELNGAYGEQDIFLGTPCKLGKKGVEEVIEVKLTSEEKKLFSNAVKQTRIFHERITEYW